jgi:predicted deacylase
MLTTAPPATELIDRILGRVAGATPGPTLLCIGGMHGNEPAGVLALRRVLARLGADASGLRGTLVGLSGNRRALAAQRRYIFRDLNRMWRPDLIAAARRLTPGLPADDDEAEEQSELERELSHLLAEAPAGRTFLLDLHTTSGPGPAFVVLDDTLANRAFALEFPVPLILGIEEQLPGTLLYHYAGQGIVTLGFEAGPNDAPASVDRAEAAVWIALEACGALPRGRRPEVAAARQLLAATTGDLPRVVEIVHRHAIKPEDRFKMHPGFASFTRVHAGQTLATDLRGPVTTSQDALLLMPLYQPQGSEGFFLARPVRPFWLRLSARLRRFRLARRLSLLPGIHRHPTIPQTYLVDPRMARWLMPELFHLLGYRREKDEGGLRIFRRRSHAD